jgi:hypothetical protein
MPFIDANDPGTPSDTDYRYTVRLNVGGTAFVAADVSPENSPVAALQDLVDRLEGSSLVTVQVVRVVGDYEALEPTAP